ncbi:MAG: RNA polymerase sigma factor [Planctomycetota bacterium]|jgi:RNA polymerase sigma-70 factor (ECF subfamily)
MESDEKLIESANKGDTEAFEAIYYRYRDWVYRLAWRFTGDRERALDVLQETFAYLLKKFPGFELTCAMTTFLYPVVKHLSLAISRKDRRLSGEEMPGEVASTLQKETHGSRSELAAVLAVLPDEHREVLLMRFVDDMALQEIAEVLNTPLSTVKSRLYRALQTLRDDKRTRDYFLA